MPPVDRNTFPRDSLVQTDYRTVAYTGATPGADSNTYVLFNSLTAPEFAANSANPSVFLDFRRYVLSLKNSAVGTIKAFGSNDGGVSWNQYYEQAVAASAATSSNFITIPLEGHLSVRIDWTNGGGAQGTWYVAQAVDGEEATFANASSGGGGGVVTVSNFPATQAVTTTQLPSTIGQKPATQSTSVVLASDDHMKGQSGPVSNAGAAEASNQIQLLKYLATPPVATDGQFVSCQGDANGNTKMREQYAPVAEDNVNGVIATKELPVAVSTYCYSVAMSSALATNLVAKAGPGVVRHIQGRIDSTAASGTFYVQLLNAAAMPANGAVTHLRAPEKFIHTTGTDTKFTIDLTASGIFASVGAVVALSSTEFTLTAATAHLSSTVLFK